MSFNDFKQILDVESVEGFSSEVERIARVLGFDSVSTLTIVERPQRTHGTSGTHPVRPPGTGDDIVVRTPHGCLNEAAVHHHVSRDPVINHCRTSSLPLVWNRETFENAGATDIWEHQARHGCRAGVALGIHLPGGRHFIVGADTSDPMPEATGWLERRVADLCLFAIFAQQSAMHLFVDQGRPGRSVAEGEANCETCDGASADAKADGRAQRHGLSARELGVLQLSSEGLTAKEIGNRLEITEFTVNKHLQSCIGKLGVANRTQAIVKALRLGLLQ